MDTRVHAWLKSRIELKHLYPRRELSTMGSITLALSPDIRGMNGSLLTLLEGWWSSWPHPVQVEQSWLAPPSALSDDRVTE